MWLRQRQRRSRPTARACPRDGSPPVDFRMYSLLFAGVLATALSSQPGSGVSTCRSRMQAAANAYERGRYLRAEELFKEALDRAKDFGPEDERHLVVETGQLPGELPGKFLTGVVSVRKHRLLPTREVEHQPWQDSASDRSAIDRHQDRNGSPPQNQPCASAAGLSASIAAGSRSITPACCVSWR